MCNICKPLRVLVYGNAETRPDERAGNNGTDGGHHPCQGGLMPRLGASFTGNMHLRYSGSAACVADAGRC